MEQAELSLIEEFAKQNPVYTSRILEFKSINDVLLILQSISPSVAVKVLEKLAPKTSLELIKRFDDNFQSKILSLMKTNNLIIILRFLNKDDLAIILKKLRLINRTKVETQLKYEVNEVGAWMNTNVPQVHSDFRVEEIKKYLQDNFAKNIFKEIFVVDNDNKLAGVIGLNKVILSDDSLHACSILKTVKYTLTPRIKLSMAQNHAGFLKKDRLPVLNKDKKLMGVFSLNDLKMGLEQGIALGITTQDDTPDGYGIYGETLLSLLNIKY